MLAYASICWHGILPADVGGYSEMFKLEGDVRYKLFPADVAKCSTWKGMFNIRQVPVYIGNI